MRGAVAIRWQQTPRAIEFDVSVPPNATGLVYLPATDPSAVTESGRPASIAPRVRLIGPGGDRLLYSIGSSHYQFAATR